MKKKAVDAMKKRADILSRVRRLGVRVKPRVGTEIYHVEEDGSLVAISVKRAKTRAQRNEGVYIIAENGELIGLTDELIDLL